MNPAPPPLIEAHGLGKSYRLYPRHFDRLKEMLWLGRRRFSEEFWALRNVSLEVYQGDAWGIVGQNGAGKSTLLKLLCGVSLASEGQVRRTGRVSALLELGIGFHPEYTGRENLALSGALMGLGQDELDERLPAILAFADIGDFVDRPLKTYSSGMSVRLAFALATCVEPDVLVTDEILAVGDEAFQKKCIRLDGGLSVPRRHPAVLRPQHAYQIKKLCGRAVWLDHGQVRLQGAASDVVQEYAEFIEAQGETNTDGTAARPVAALTAGENRVIDVRLLNGQAQDTSQFAFGQPFRARVRVEAGTGETKPPVIHLGLVRPDMVPVYGVSSDMDGAVLRHVEGRVYQIDYVLPQLSLLPGRYVLRAHAMDSAGLRHFDTVEREFSVRGENRELGLCYLPHRWET